MNSDPMKPNLIKGLNLWQGFATLKKCHQMKCDHQRSSEKNSPLGLSIHVIRYSLITDIAWSNIKWLWIKLSLEFAEINVLFTSAETISQKNDSKEIKKR
jgi:hypothetical protein